MLHKAVFLDRDGTIAKDVHYCRRVEDFQILPKAAEAIRSLNKEGYKVVVITNQSGIARGYFTEETLSMIHRKMHSDLQNSGAFIDAVYFCPHHPDDGCECRKPKPTLLIRAAKEIGITLGQSYMVGDDIKDVQAGLAAGCRTVWLRSDGIAPAEMSQDQLAHHIASDLAQAVEWIIRDSLSGSVCPGEREA